MRQSQAGRATQDVGQPQLIQAMVEAMRIPDLRAKILFTLAMLVVFRFVAHVPIPGVDVQALSQAFEQNALLPFLDLFSGGALSNLSIAALGVYPYITSSIVMQILTPVIPQLKALSQEGEFGRQRINQYTHYMAVPIALFQGFGQLSLLQQSNVLPGVSLGLNITTLTMIASMVAGTMFLVWLGELITEKGIGNGVSLIIFGGIVAGFPQMIGQGFLESDEGAGLLMLVILGFATIYTIVLFNEAQRRIPVQYGRSVFRGGRMQRQSGSTFLPLRVNSAGMIPLIFSFSIIILPVTVASYFRDPLERQHHHPGHSVLRRRDGPNPLPVLGRGVLPDTRIHVLLYARHIPTAEPGGEPAEEWGVHPGHQTGTAHPGVPQPRHHSDYVGRGALPGNRCGAPVRIPDNYRCPRSHPEQHQSAHHGRRGPRYHAPAGSTASHAQL